MKITTLIENTKYEKAKEVKPEHGISLFIESNSYKILFDTGASSLFSINAKKLNISLEEVDFVVISHGHLDHGGGLKNFLQENAEAQVYLKEDAFKSYYIKLLGFIRKYIGLDKSLIQKYGHRFIFIKDYTEVINDVFIISNILEKHPKPLGNKKLLKKIDYNYVSDNFKHELILVVRENDGLVVFTGCSHNGILNMIDTVEDQFKGERIKAVFGGFHLMNPTTKKMMEKQEEVVRIGKLLYDKARLMKVFTGHCTGETAYDLLKSQMGEKLEYFSTGSIISI